MSKFLHLRQRMLGAGIYGGFILLAYLWNIYSFLGAVFIILLLAIHEFKKISCLITKKRTNTFLAYLSTLLISGFLLYSTMSLSFYELVKILIWIGVIHHVLMASMIFSKSFKYYQLIPDFLMVTFYLGLSFGALYVYSVPFTDYEKWRVILVLFCVWGTDIGAYFMGSLFGRYKLAPHISPNKTWEGLFGGWLVAAVLGYFLAEMIELSQMEGVLLGSLIALTAVAGDLVESKMKRMLKLKDSGNLLPGHGGILDRIDGYIFCQPFVALIFIYLI